MIEAKLLSLLDDYLTEGSKVTKELAESLRKQPFGQPLPEPLHTRHTLILRFIYDLQELADTINQGLESSAKMRDESG